MSPDPASQGEVQSRPEGNSGHRQVGFLTYDLQPFTVDCLARIAERLPESLKAYPVFGRIPDEPIPFPYRPSHLSGRFFSVRKPGSTQEGFTSSINWRAAWDLVWQSDIVVLFGIQGGSALVATLLATLLRRPLISVNQTLPPLWEGKRRWWIRLLKGWILNRCRIHIVQTPVSGEALQQVYQIDPALHVQAPFEGGARHFGQLIEKVDRTRHEIRHSYGWFSDECIFLFVGALLRFKGIPILMAAAQQLKERHGDAFTIVCIGPEPAQAGEPTLVEYRQQAQEMGVIHRIIFPGPASLESLAEAYLGADVCILPTQKDTWGKVLVEGALAGLPLITTEACGAAGSIVLEGETGYVVPPGEVAPLVAAMEKLMDGDRRLKMGTRARERCLEFSDPHKEALGYVEAVARVVAG
ncbi:MAG: glycosyltransferase family 4 protein [Magnetococcales bacterium]|nr:glycosyltransferase family 4 protein [Magnetococcales bacterium]